MPRAVACKHQAVVIGSEGESLLIAVPNPWEPGLSDLLSSVTRQPVRLAGAGPHELALALTLCRDPDSLEARQRERLAWLIHRLGLSHLLDERARRVLSMESDSAEYSPLAALSELPDSWAQELTGLLQGLPYVDAIIAQLRPSLRLLLPPSLRDSDVGKTLAPWGLEGDTLVLACTELPAEKQLHIISAWSGYPVRCVLMAASVLSTLADQREQAGVPGKRVPLWKKLVRRRARFLNLDERYLRAVSRKTKMPLELVKRRFQPERQPVKRKALPTPGRRALDVIPAALAHSLRCLPLHCDGESLDVAVAEGRKDLDQLVALLAALTGFEIDLHFGAAAELDRALLRAYLRPVDADAGQPRPSSVTGVLSAALAVAGDNPVARCQTLAALHALPSIRLDQYAILAEAITTLSLDQMETLQAVPLHREGDVLWVAVVEPQYSVFAELHELTGLTIRPVLATSDAIFDRLTALRALSEPAAVIRIEGNPLLDRLQADRRVTKNDLARILADTAVPMDVALDQAGILTQREFTDLASEVSNFPTIDLRLRSHEEEIFDALGERTSRKVWRDPVDPVVTQLLNGDTMRSLGVLPVRREADGLLLAVADPYDPALHSLMSVLASESPRIVLAPRPAIITALARAGGQVPLGDRLLRHGIVTPQELARALQLHRASGVRLGQALLSLDLISQQQLSFVLAEQLDLPFFQLEGIHFDEKLARLLPAEAERRLGVLPLYYVNDELMVATPDPLNQTALDEVAARADCAVSPVVCTEHDFESAMERLYRDEYLQYSTSELVARTPDESASSVLNNAQQVTFLGIGLVLVALLWRDPAIFGILLTGVCSAFYVTFSVYRSYLIYRALSHDLEIPVSEKELRALKDESLPIYTILVPLYKEAQVLPTLLLGLSKLDYPATKLDVKILLEEDDIETRAAIAAMRLPAYVHPVVVPAAEPRCKPKACNYGLIHARGEYVVIYDAEDVPDPDQLKKVIIGFRKSKEEVACLQAKLNYYNGRQNLLTSWFTTEYSMWFDLFLPGLDASHAPIPLGGTSNHFPIARLREIGAWDPYNVTEDADLGVRLYRRGWTTGIVDSTTLEEANSEVYNWIRQRSRWVKGYIQTYLVHMRHPVRLWRALGTKAFFSFNMVVGGTFIGFLLNPIFWCLTALWYLAHAGFIRAIYPAPVFYLGMISLVIGNFAFIYLNVAGCLRRGHYAMVKHALISPLYWGLMSLAAWKGLVQLFTNPFYWEKTTHGLYPKKGRARAAPEADQP